MARISGVLTFYKIVDGSIETIVSYSDIGNTCRNTFDVDDSGKLHIINSYTGKYIVYPDGNSYSLPYDKITSISFFSVKGRVPYLILTPDHYLLHNGEWVLNRTINLGSLNALLWKNRIVTHSSTMEGGFLHSHIIRTKYVPEVDFPESEYEYSNDNISFTIYDNELHSNANYSLLLNSSVINTGNFSSGVQLFQTSGLEIGDYNFTLNFEDGYGNSFNSSKIVRIVNKKPVITRDFQQIFVKGQIRSLNWSIVDKSVKNPTYSIYINGGLMVSNESLVSDKISFDISSLLPGTYQIKVEVNDGLGETVDLVTGIMIQAVPPEVPEEDDNDPGDNNQPIEVNMNIVYGIIGAVGLISIILIVKYKIKK